MPVFHQRALLCYKRTHAYDTLPVLLTREDRMTGYHQGEFFMNSLCQRIEVGVTPNLNKGLDTSSIIWRKKLQLSKHKHQGMTLINAENTSRG